MRGLILMPLLFLAACGPDPYAMTNDQIISETNKCKAAGLKAEALVNGLGGAVITRIQCSPTK